MAKVLVVSTTSYTRLENMLKTLMEEYAEKQFEFYIVIETYGCKPPVQPKFKNILAISDSSNDEEMKSIIEGVCKWPAFDYSVQTDEYAVTILAQINTKLNFSGLTLHQEHRFRDKVRMKQLLSDDVCKPKLYSKQDIVGGLIDFPVIVKPRTFASSRGVYLVQNEKDLNNRIKNNYIDYSRASIDTMEDLEIEEYIDANTFHIDGLIFHGDICYCNASKYIGSCFDYTKGHLLGSMKVQMLQQKKALCFAKNVHRDLQIPDGAFHLECFYKNQEFIFLEIGIRPGGGGVVASIEAGTGINLTKEHVKCQLGIKPTCTGDTHTYFGWLNFPCIFDYDSPKYVTSITMPSPTPSSLYSSVIPQIGQSAIANFVNYSNCLGDFIFVANTLGQLEKDMYVYAEKYKVDVA